MNHATDASDKPKLFADIGTIRVPNNYVHTSRLDSFAREYRNLFYYYNHSITDTNYSRVSAQLSPGKVLRVLGYKQTVPGTMTSDERVAFLTSMGAVYTGAQGLSLVFEQLREKLLKGYWYVSFDVKSALWSDSAGHGVPILDAHSADAYGLRLGRYENQWRDVDITLCFCDVTESNQ